MADSRPALRIAYLTVGKATDISEWSGLNASIRNAILQQGCLVDDVDQLGVSYTLASRLRKRAHAALFGTNYALERTRQASARWSRLASERIAPLPSVDAVVSTGSLPTAFLDVRQPLAIWADATFHALRETYPEHARYARSSVAEGDRIEQSALTRASLVCFASEWAADDAVSYYGVPREKVRVIPFGANCQSPFAGAEAAAAVVAQRDWSVARFVFVGVDWQRKGGDTAVAIVRRLNELGTKSVLTVVGCTPPDSVTSLPFVECLGYLSKKNDAERVRLDAALLSAHFLLVPTVAECFGLVFAEASAYALPSISRAVGGVASAVRHGRTGFLLPPDAGSDAYCDLLRPLLADRGRYAAICRDAYQDYRDRLNWQVAGARFVAELRGVIAGPAGDPSRR